MGKKEKKKKTELYLCTLKLWILSDISRFPELTLIGNILTGKKMLFPALYVINAVAPSTVVYFPATFVWPKVKNDITLLLYED